MKKKFVTDSANLFKYLDCPKEKEYVVYDIVNTRTEYEQNIIKKYCGEDFGGTSKKVLTPNEKQVYFGRLLPKIETLYLKLVLHEKDSGQYKSIIDKYTVKPAVVYKLSDIPKETAPLAYIKPLYKKSNEQSSKSDNSKNHSNSSTASSFANFYDNRANNTGLNLFAYFQKEYSYSEFSQIFCRLSDSDKRKVLLACGEKFDGNRTNKDSYVIKSIIGILKPYLTEMFGKERYYNAMSVYRENKNYDVVTDAKSTVESASALSTNQELKNDDVKSSDVGNSNRKINSRKGGIAKKSVQNLVKYFYNAYSVEELYAALDDLKLEEKEILIKYCGPKLDGIGAKVLTDDEKKQISPNIMPKLKTRLNRKYGNSRFYFALYGIEKSEEETVSVKSRKGIANLVNYFKDIYTVDEIFKALDLLEPDEKDLVLKYCGPNLNGKNSQYLSDEDEYRFKKSVFFKLKVRLNRNSTNKNNITMKKYKKVTNLIYYFDEVYTVEKLYSILDMLKPEEKDIIIRYCGPNLDGIDTQPVTVEEKKKIRQQILSKIKLRLINDKIGTEEYKKKNRKNLIKYYNDVFSIDEIYDVLDKIGPDEKEMLIKYCGPKFDGENTEDLTKKEKKDIKVIICKLTSRLRIQYGEERISNALLYDESIVEEVRKKRNESKNTVFIECSQTVDINGVKYYKVDNPKRKRRKVNNLIGYFNNFYTLEEMYKALNEIPTNEKELIIKYCGPKLDGQNGVDLSSSEISKINTNIVPKIKTRLSSLFGKERLSESLNLVSDTKNSSVKINDEQEKLIEEEVSEKVIVNHELKNDDRIRETQNTEIPIIPKLANVVVNENNELSLNDYRNLKVLLDNMQVSELSAFGLNREQIIISSLLHGYNGMYFTTKQIAEFLKVDESEVKRIAKEVVKNYQNALNNQIDQYILTLDNSQEE